MSNLKFTPGPWHASLSLSKKFWVILDKDSRCVADTYWSATRAEEEANARLLAAAPEMYAELENMCQKCRNEHNVLPCEWCNTQKVLRKARGESEVSE